MINKNEVLRNKSKYKKGMRVELVKMDDKQRPCLGEKGTITGVNDEGDIMVNWDSGSSLKLIVGLDEFKIIKE